MIIPVRCFSCGKPIAQLWEEFKERTEKGEDAKKVLDQLINALNTQYRDVDPNAKPLIGTHGYLEK